MASSSAARRASYGFAYCGFSTMGVGGGGFSFGSAPRPARYGAHTPDRSGEASARAALQTAQRTSTPTAVGPVLSDRPISDRSRLSPDAAGTVAEHAAVAQRDLREQPAGLTAAKRTQHDGDLVARL